MHARTLGMHVHLACARFLASFTFVREHACRCSSMLLQCIYVYMSMHGGASGLQGLLVGVFVCGGAHSMLQMAGWPCTCCACLLFKEMHPSHSATSAAAIGTCRKPECNLFVSLTPHSFGVRTQRSTSSACPRSPHLLVLAAS